MSKMNAGISEAYYTIDKWRGVNETGDGGRSLKNGEARSMVNFRVSDTGALTLRPGLKRLIGLSSSYYVKTGTEDKLAVTTVDYTGEKITVYPTAAVNDNGLLVLSGESAEIDYTGYGTHSGWYYRDDDGTAYQLTDCSLSAAPAPVNGGSIELLDDGKAYIEVVEQKSSEGTGGSSKYTTLYLSDAGELALTGQTTGVVAGRYLRYNANPKKIYRVRSLVSGNPKYAYLSTITLADYARHEWYGREVSAEAVEGNTAVRALWCGIVGGQKRWAAACANHLWSISESGGVWSKTDIGSIDTTGRVSLFGFGEKLYILDGSEYRVWDGTHMGPVSGYVPLVASASAPGGGGQLLEQANKLTLARRQRFSADGTATEYQLLETQITRVDKVTVGAKPVLGYTVDVSAGKVTFSSAPAAGSNNVEIWYTASLTKTTSYTGDGVTRQYTIPADESSLESVTASVGGTETEAFTVEGSVLTFDTAPADKAAIEITTVSKDLRALVSGMRHSEFFNGAGDNRVFLYGDGSSKAVYSGVREDTGKASMEYFPDLNEMEIGNDNTPITAMIRHYSRLLIFKSSSTYSAYYSGISLADGISTAGFYVSSVNREIGSDAYGQAALVGNRPRTLDAGNIYEWKATSTSGNITNDARNADRVSRPVELTLKDMGLSRAVCYYDKYAHEYYAVSGGTALVQNAETGAWYVYKGFPVRAMLRDEQLLMAGTDDGYIHSVSSDYGTDNGAAIAAEWRSGALDFDRPWVRKYSPELWVSMAPQEGGEINVSIATDGTAGPDSGSVQSRTVAPAMDRVRLKSSKFTLLSLGFDNEGLAKTGTVTGCTIRVKYTGNQM